MDKSLFMVLTVRFSNAIYSSIVIFDGYTRHALLFAFSKMDASFLGNLRYMT